jgi:hypothetical protein
MNPIQGHYRMLNLQQFAPQCHGRYRGKMTGAAEGAAVVVTGSLPLNMSSQERGDNRVRNNPIVIYRLVDLTDLGQKKKRKKRKPLNREV